MTKYLVLAGCVFPSTAVPASPHTRTFLRPTTHSFLAHGHVLFPVFHVHDATSSLTFSPPSVLPNCCIPSSILHRLSRAFHEHPIAACLLPTAGSAARLSRVWRRPGHISSSCFKRLNARVIRPPSVARLLPRTRLVSQMDHPNVGTRNLFGSVGHP